MRIYTTEQKERKRIYNHSRYLANAESIKENVRKHSDANKEKLSQSAREYYKANSDKIREMARLYYIHNKASVIDNSARWARSNPERLKSIKAKWCRLNRAKCSAAAHRRAARKRTNSTPDQIISADRKIKELKSKKTAPCSYCLEVLPTKSMHLDHIKPLASGGVHSDKNLTLACPKCNCSKGSKILNNSYFAPAASRGLALWENLPPQ